MESIRKSYLLTSRVYPTKSFDELNKLLPGPTTDELASLISENVVRCGIRVFNVMRDIEKSITPISRRKLEQACKALGWTDTPKEIKPKRPIAKEQLNELGETEFQTRTQIDQLEILLRANPGLARRIEKYYLFPREPNRPRDYPLNILILYLRSHILKVRPRPHNELICDFLAEQEIHDRFMPKEISDIVKKISVEQFEKVYRVFHEIYEAPGRIILNEPGYTKGRIYLRAGDRIEILSGKPTMMDDLMEFIRDTRRVVVESPSSERDCYIFPPWDIFMS